MTCLGFLLLLGKFFRVDSHTLGHVVGFVDTHEAVSQLEHVVPEASMTSRNVQINT